MQFHDPARFPRGFRTASRNCGLKPTGKDLALFVSDVDAAAAAVFTLNQFPGAPIVLGRETIKSGRLRAIVANSKVSNVATGARGLENARRMAAAAAHNMAGRCLPSNSASTRASSELRWRRLPRAKVSRMRRYCDRWVLMTVCRAAGDCGRP